MEQLFDGTRYLIDDNDDNEEEEKEVEKEEYLFMCQTL